MYCGTSMVKKLVEPFGWGFGICSQSILPIDIYYSKANSVTGLLPLQWPCKMYLHFPTKIQSKTLPNNLVSNQELKTYFMAIKNLVHRKVSWYIFTWKQLMAIVSFTVSYKWLDRYTCSLCIAKDPELLVDSYRASPRQPVNAMPLQYSFLDSFFSFINILEFTPLDQGAPYLAQLMQHKRRYNKCEFN